MDIKKKAAEIMSVFNELYPDAECSLRYKKSFTALDSYSAGSPMY
jgi:hypothetical protein